MTRRHSMKLLAATGLTLAFAPTATLALSEGEAKALVDKLVGEINRVIASGKSESAMYGDFERIFARYSDTSYIAAYTLGNDGRRASSAQKKAYSAAFETYVSRKYGRRFREFIGGRLEVTGVKQVKKWFEVSAVAYLKGQAPFEVTFLVSDRSGGHKFFNLYIEGINMLLTERTEIGSMLDKRRGDIDALISDLKQIS
ncbi:phospholipid-binding protein MlaC [Lentibacter sp. XHP0401]|uniref:MlaC/ttg2D family ABC transporter substrate-binding protein n=1 Tax=Lentibacter sp. XHP0401 TaxID=2984334 RepID=UPI0021E75FB5|nr:ABC transporter substrate-binding protein [Lentibacter sp. XHP0401]MCV2893089.1 ABC transporter substrate-binding protein [Lentibacter sp. XHP0401]